MSIVSSLMHRLIGNKLPHSFVREIGQEKLYGTIDLIMECTPRSKIEIEMCKLLKCSDMAHIEYCSLLNWLESRNPYRISYLIEKMKETDDPYPEEFKHLELTDKHYLFIHYVKQGVWKEAD